MGKAMQHISFDIVTFVKLNAMQRQSDTQCQKDHLNVKFNLNQDLSVYTATKNQYLYLTYTSNQKVFSA